MKRHLNNTTERQTVSDKYQDDDDFSVPCENEILEDYDILQFPYFFGG